MRAYYTDATDIIEHLPTLQSLSADCTHITELGVRHVVSTWAFIGGLTGGGTLVSVDIVEPPEENLKEAEEACVAKGIDFKFILGDTLNIVLEETDLLFIDTLHTDEQLSKELELHSSKAKKYIVLHDTESCAKELWPAIGILLSQGKWGVSCHYRNNNGLTVLERHGRR